jgi:anti-sigma factor RsiW
VIDRCDARRIQDYLDGELSAADQLAFREHLTGCVHCAGELALYQRAFKALDAMAFSAPSELLMERVMDRVLPSRLRRRWVKTLGFGYAGVFAASIVAIAVWGSQPAPRAMLAGFMDAFSQRFVQAVTFAFNAVAFLLLSLADGWGMAASTGERLAPLVRALGTLLSHPGVQIALVTSASACVALLWWIRPRGKGENRGVRHVGMLGF